jgi:hypothetical protein
MNLSQYKTLGSNEWSMYKNIPISLLPQVKKQLKIMSKRLNLALKFRFRYRGPRDWSVDVRPRSQRQQDCLKRNANRFSVYMSLPNKRVAR